MKGGPKLPADMPLLPRQASEERPLLMILTIMAFLASLILLLAMSGMRASQSWQEDVTGRFTIQVLPDDGQSMDNLVAAVKSIVSDTYAGSQITRLSDQDARDLLRPWLGDVDLPKDIPLPQIVKVKLPKDAVLNVRELERAFGQAEIETVIDDHARWRKNIKRTWRAIQFGLWGMIVIMIGASAAVASFAAQSVLRVRQNIVSVLGQVGAADGYVMRLFVFRFMDLALRAALLGAVLALLSLVLFSVVTRAASADILPSIPLHGTDFAALGALVIVTGLICGGTAAVTTQRKLRQDRRLL